MRARLCWHWYWSRGKSKEGNIMSRERNQLQEVRETIPSHGSVIDPRPPPARGIKNPQAVPADRDRSGSPVSFNLKIRRLGRKDLIKIENTRLTEQQANQLALFAPRPPSSIIEGLRGGEEAPAGAAGVHRRGVPLPNSSCISTCNAGGGRLLPGARGERCGAA